MKGKIVTHIANAGFRQRETSCGFIVELEITQVDLERLGVDGRFNDQYKQTSN